MKKVHLQWHCLNSSRYCDLYNDWLLINMLQSIAAMVGFAYSGYIDLQWQLVIVVCSNILYLLSIQVKFTELFSFYGSCVDE